MTSTLTKNERLLELAARTICAHELSGFCQNVGGDLGCKVGRGFPADPALCVATRDQLLLSGRWAAAEALVAASLRESIVHGLRSRGWSRIDAENEADERIERSRALAATTNNQDDT